MAQYTVTHICGHSSQMTLYGKCAERKWKLRKRSEQPCIACIRAEESRRAHQQAEERGLPDIDGTEKQIEWAERIRYHTLLAIDAELTADDYHAEIPIPDDLAFLPGETMTIREIVDKITGETQARWWIDNAKQVQDIGHIPFFTRKVFVVEFMRRAAWGERMTTDDLAKSADVRQQFRGLYQ